MRFGETIRELAREQGLQLKQVASRSGITRQGLYYVMKNDNPQMKTVKRIAAGLGVSPAIFFEDETEKSA